MWSDDYDFPSREDTREDDIEQEIPEGDLDWSEGWREASTEQEAA